MYKLLVTISIISYILCQVFAIPEAKISATYLNEYPDDVDVTPFTRVGKKLYHFGQSRISWFKAHLVCRSMGGYLAAFKNQQELIDLSNYLKTNYPTDRWWWIAGSDIQGEGDFHWYNTGERITYADWSKGQPDNAGGNENCVFLWFTNPQYQMNDWICANAAYYICEADKPKTVVVSVF